MACALGFPELASHNPFIADLVEQGYHVDFIGGYLIIYGLPYLDNQVTLQYGDWASPVDLNGAVVDPPSNHQAWFRGGRPHDRTGQQVRLGGGEHKVFITEGFTTNYSFSFKLKDGDQMRAYKSFEEKVRTYLDAITAPAMSMFPDATPLRGIAVRAAAQGSPLRYPDTMSARYHVNDIAAFLKGKKVAIIGLGGTGSYILDLIARTHLERIALFDDDKVHIHTIFRIPGYIQRAIGRLKVEVLAQEYANWHGGIEAFAERITAANIDCLREFDFVFVAVDDGEARLLIVDWLSANSIPFVDCGMGLNRSKVGLNGLVRITGTDRSAFERTLNTPYLPTENAKNDEYRKQAQITEFNALNAIMAVIRFKQHFKMLDRLDDAASYVFESATLEIVAEGRTP